VLCWLTFPSALALRSTGSAAELLPALFVGFNHQGLENRLIRGRTTSADNNLIVQRRQRLGGMLNFYYRKAA